VCVCVCVYVCVCVRAMCDVFGRKRLYQVEEINRNLA